MDRLPAEELLRLRIGLDPSTAGPALVRRAIRDRMRALGITPEKSVEYLDTLGQSDGELQALVEEIVVPESWFFRDTHPFILLGEIASTWIDEPSRPPFRALSLPSAGGEEPYSIAMTLLDLGLTPKRFRVDAVDISERSLTVARRGFFSSNSFRANDITFRDRHFTKVPEGFELDSQIRSSVRFHQGNVLDPTLLQGEPRYDAVFCRNLLIYLDEPARKLAVANLDRLLSFDGTLLLGHAEPLSILGPTFRARGEPRYFAFVRKAGEPSIERNPVKSGLPAIRPKPALPARIEIKRPGPLAVRPIDARLHDAVSMRDEASGIADNLETAKKLADQGRYEEASKLCEAEIKKRGPSAGTYFLLGVIRQARGEREEAESFFHKTVYLDPDHSEALFSLALLAQRRGDRTAADNFRRRAGRASETKS